MNVTKVAFTILLYCHECVLNVKILFVLSISSAESLWGEQDQAFIKYFVLWCQSAPPSLMLPLIFLSNFLPSCRGD